MDEKLDKMVKCLDKWMGLREEGISLASYCTDRDVRVIGIYGYGRLGRHLVWELERGGLSVSWIMDQRYDVLGKKNKCYRFLSPNEGCRLENVDMIIVTAVEDYYQIEAELCKYMDVEIVSVEEIVDVMCR